MNDAELYQANNSMQRSDVLMCLREFGSRIRWKGADRVVDLGCGDGGTTACVLRTFLPSDFAQLVGSDVSARMVSHAQAHHADARTAFCRLDLAAPLPIDLTSTFDHAFSFYMLHWIRDKERAFRNIYELLSHGGDCLVMFLARMPILDVYWAHAAQPDWSEYMKHMHCLFADYNTLQNPEKEVKNIMENIGFKNIFVEHKEMQFVFKTLDEYANSLLAVDPFDIPEEMRQEYVRIHLQILQSLCMPALRLTCARAGGAPDSVHMRYSLVIASAIK